MTDRTTIPLDPVVTSLTPAHASADLLERLAAATTAYARDRPPTHGGDADAHLLADDGELALHVRIVDGTPLAVALSPPAVDTRTLDGTSSEVLVRAPAGVLAAHLMGERDVLACGAGARALGHAHHLGVLAETFGSSPWRAALADAALDRRDIEDLLVTRAGDRPRPHVHAVGPARFGYWTTPPTTASLALLGRPAT